MFILLKILLFFFRPLIWIIILFLFGFFIKKPVWKKRLIRTAFALLLFFSNPFFIRTLLKWYEPQPVELPATARYSAGIVLGGFVAYNLKDDKGYFNAAADRFIQTALLYKAGQIQKVIVAAGNGYIVNHNFQEALFVKDHLVQLGIPAADILTDGLSKNTYENAVNSKKLVDSARLQGPFLLITSAMHLPRARKVFARQGLDVQVFPCDLDTKNTGNNFGEDYLLPSAPALHAWDLLIKEIVGITVYKITGKG